MGLLDGGIKKIIGNAAAGIFLDFTIIRKESVLSVNPWEAPVTTSTSYACKGIVSKFKQYEIDGENVKINDKKIVLLAEGLAITPELGDLIQVPNDTRKYEVVGMVTRDPAGATITAHCR
jgi:hypothetical protein